MRADMENVTRAVARVLEKYPLPEGIPEGEQADMAAEIAGAALDSVYGPLKLRDGGDRGCRWPDGMEVPADWITEAERLGMARDRALVEADSFVDFWLSASGQNARKRNWRATWRNWIRRSLGERVARATHAGDAHNVRW